jgi:wobble nucleotide-excising tRNase
MKISRSGSTSTLSEWNVDQDSITEHDRNYRMVSNFIENGHGDDERSVAVALRPMLESYVRITCPNIFPPGSLLGPFLGTCQQRENTPNQILSSNARAELKALLDYANDFHHDTNQAWQTANINEQELLDHARRTIDFVSI